MYQYLVKISGRTFTYPLLIVLLLVFGIAIRTFHFPDIPPGLNQDEAGSAYEAYSIAKTGMDKWGNIYPAYFPSWGSGQNALLAYLSVPFIKILGLNIVAARLVSLLIGILTLPLLFFCLRPLGRFLALLATLLLVGAPWHFMLSRWALESNLLPYCMLLGCACLSRALITQQRRWVIPSLLPFALALYAYGTTVIVLPLFFLLILCLNYSLIKKQWASWCIALGLFSIAAFPFALSFFKNYIIHRDLAWSHHLPFSTPLFPSTRLSQVGGTSHIDIISRNLGFMSSGCNDETNCNILANYHLLFPLAFPLAFAGLLLLLYTFIKKERSMPPAPDSIINGIFLSWALASLILFFAFELNINRFNHFYIPAIVLSAWFIDKTLGKIKNNKWRAYLQITVLCCFAINICLATRSYFTAYPKGNINIEFNTGLGHALQIADKLPVSQLLITDTVELPYVYTLFYLQYPPALFQQQVQYEIAAGQYQVNRFGKYVFYKQYLDHSKPYGYVGIKGEYPAALFHKKVIDSSGRWEVGIVF